MKTDNSTPMPPVRKIDLPSDNPEDVLVSDKGIVFTGTHDGWIYQITPETGETRQLANTGGSPLGLEFLSEDQLLICDCQQGLLNLNLKSLKLETLASGVGDREFNFCNNASVAKDGTIYFSESSTRNKLADSNRDIIEHIGTGSLFCRKPDGEISCLLDGLQFANGVCLFPDETFVLVAESGLPQLNRFYLSGPKQGNREILPLPALPDNLSIGSDGLLWVALVAPATKELAGIQKMPLTMRKLVARVPDKYLPKGQQILRVAAYDFEGNCVHDFAGDASQYYLVTGVREHNGRVYMGTIVDKAIAYFDL